VLVSEPHPRKDKLSLLYPITRRQSIAATATQAAELHSGTISIFKGKTSQRRLFSYYSPPPGSSRGVYIQLVRQPQIHTRAVVGPASPSPGAGSRAVRSGLGNHRNPCQTCAQYDKKIEVSLPSSGRRHEV